MCAVLVCVLCKLVSRSVKCGACKWLRAPVVVVYWGATPRTQSPSMMLFRVWLGRMATVACCSLGL